MNVSGATATSSPWLPDPCQGLWLSVYSPSWDGSCVRVPQGDRTKRLWRFIDLPFPQKRKSEKVIAPHSSTLAWKIPWTEEPGRVQSRGSLSQTRLSDFTFTFYFHALEKEMATHCSSLTWKIPWMEGDGGATRLQRVKTGLRDFTFFLSFIPYYQVWFKRPSFMTWW